MNRKATLLIGLSALLILGASGPGLLWSEESPQPPSTSFLESSFRDWNTLWGPFYAHETRHFGSRVSIAPFFSATRDERLEQSEWDVLYPLLSYDQYGEEKRFHLFQLLSFSAGSTLSADSTPRGSSTRQTLFPFFFRQASSDPEKRYHALFPFYGTVKNRLLRDELKVVMFPLYVQTKKRDVVTDNYLVPLFHRRRGNELSGWQIWPLMGWEQKGVTTKTNVMGDPSMVGGHKKFNLMWPFYFHDRTDLETDDPKNHRALLPFFSTFTSPLRDTFTVPWPLGLTVTHDREQGYRELGLPWPFIVFARGEGKTVNRLWPFFGRAANPELSSQFYAWPLYRAQQLETQFDRIEQRRYLFFLYVDKTETRLKTSAVKRRRDFWPLFTWQQSTEGDHRFQWLALAEPFFPANETIPRHYSPLWSLYRSTRSAETGVRSTSFLWNLYRREATKEEVKGSALFGLVRWRRTENQRTLKLLGIRLKGTLGSEAGSD